MISSQPLRLHALAFDAVGREAHRSLQGRPTTAVFRAAEMGEFTDRPRHG